MRLLGLVVVAALLCAALAQEDDRPSRGRVRGRTRLISRQRLADVIDGAVVEETAEDGRKRVLVRRPGSARRRVKVIRRPRPSPAATTAAPEPTTTEPPVTTFSPALSSFVATSAPASFSTRPVFSATPAPEPEVFLQSTPSRSARQRLPVARRPAAPEVAAPTSAPRRQRPAEPVSSSGGRQLNRKEEVVGTVRNYSYYNEDGSFTFGYEAEDGSFKEETRGTDCVVRGKYGYIDPDGVKREFNYESGNPCDETTTEEAQFDDQGFPILDEEGGLVGGVDPLDDQPIRRPNTQFISQTKEERLPEEELKQFRQSTRRRRPEVSRTRPTSAPAPAREEIEQTFTRQPEPVTFRPRLTFSAAPEPETRRPPATFRPRTTFSAAPEPETRRPPVTFRPAVRIEQEPVPSFPSEPRPTPSSLPPPRPFSLQPRPSGSFNFDEALSEIQSRPTTSPALLQRPLDADDTDFALNKPKGAVSGNFNHQLVFDPATGKHRTDLVQTLSEGTEIRIGEHLNSFGAGPSTTTTPRPFQNTVFQSFSSRPPPPPTTRRPPPPPPTTRPPPPPPTARPVFAPRPSAPPSFNTFNQPPQPFRPPQSARQPFTVFNTQPRPQQQQQQQQRPVFSVFNQPRPQPQPQPQQPQPRPQPRPPLFLGPQPAPQPTPSSSQQSQLTSGAATSGSRPVQQVSFGTQVANPVFSRFGVPQPFGQFGSAPPQPQSQNQFRPPQPINFFGQAQG